jgi:hypothetical protein
MKKRLFTAVASVVLCAAAFVGYQVYESHVASPESDLVTRNLEALTWLEVIHGVCISGCADQGGIYCCTVLNGDTGVALNYN